MRSVSDVNLSRLPLHLRMALQTQVRVTLHEHFPIDRTMRRMADDASLAHGFMFENKRAGLFAVTLPATFILSRHGQAALCFENIFAVRVVALKAIHVPFVHCVALRQTKFRLYLQMAMVASRRIFSRIYYEFAATAPRFDVLAGRPVTRFATGPTLHLRGLDVDARMGTDREDASDIRMAFIAGLVADELRSRNFRRGHDPAPGKMAAGNQKKGAGCGCRAAHRQRPHRKAPLRLAIFPGEAWRND